ncbi:MAP kinase kinase kinase [Mycena indigotica]|uniref:MAP kinase kinase kinase n=1 Tax=Mycena indigotica TaxID=2126181 RepID=A0A8H6TB15_9AGAR|nr:MAP kinase kinase kinase [Mycena indigotica]KAF7312580.1 MAP kinase kinase kinase [Mycena indigotica]
MWTGSRPWAGHETADVFSKLLQSTIPPLPKDTKLTKDADDFRQKCFAMWQTGVATCCDSVASASISDADTRLGVRYIHTVCITSTFLNPVDRHDVVCGHRPTPRFNFPSDSAWLTMEVTRARNANPPITSSGLAMAIRQPLSVAGPGRTLATAYQSLGRVFEKTANRIASRMGLGPLAILERIENFMGQDSAEREAKIAELKTSVSPKLSRYCSRMLGYALPNEAATTQIDAFQCIVLVSTRYFGLRSIFVSEFQRTTQASVGQRELRKVWGRRDVFAQLDDFISALDFVVECLTECSISGIVDEQMTKPLWRLDEDETGLTVVERLLIASSCDDAFESPTKLAIRYLGGILECSSYWRQRGVLFATILLKILIRNIALVKDLGIDVLHVSHAQPESAMLAELDLEGIDIFTDSVLAGVRQHTQAHGRDQLESEYWYSAFSELLFLLRHPRAEDLLPSSWDTAKNTVMESLVPVFYSLRKVETFALESPESSAKKQPQDHKSTLFKRMYDMYIQRHGDERHNSLPGTSDSTEQIETTPPHSLPPSSPLSTPALAPDEIVPQLKNKPSLDSDSISPSNSASKTAYPSATTGATLQENNTFGVERSPTASGSSESYRRRPRHEDIYDRLEEYFPASIDAEVDPSDPPVSVRGPAVSTLREAGHLTAYQNISSPAKWVRGELIGRGTYGRVYLGMNAVTGEMIAVKQVDYPSDERDLRAREVVKALRLEHEMLKDLSHPNVVEYLGFEETPTQLSLFLEYVPGGSIGGSLAKHGKLPENVTKFFTSQVLEGVQYIHSQGCTHRDIKADNVLLEHSGVCKLADFGIAKRKVDEIDTAMQGTVFWMAPELVNTQKKKYNSKVDIWSVGCLVLEMWTGSRPWKNMEMVEVMFRLFQSRAPPPLPDDLVLTEAAEGFRQRCFEPNPEDRPTASELRRHPYLKLPSAWEFRGVTEET